MALSIAIVTGSNKGIGFHIASKLFASGLFSHVYLTARTPQLGEEARDKILALHHDKTINGLKTQLEVHQLDVTNQNSVQNLVAFIQQKFFSSTPIPNGFVLVNNAGFAFKNAATEPFPEQARTTNDINFYGTLRITQALLPFINQVVDAHPDANARIINVSSTAGLLKQISNAELRQKFVDETLDVQQLETLVEQFVALAKENQHVQAGWPNSAYSVSKISMTALSTIWARKFPKVQSSSCCPGWCRTDMAGDKASKSAEEGSETPVWLATEQQNNLAFSGKFFSDKKQKSWLDGSFL